MSKSRKADKHLTIKSSYTKYKSHLNQIFITVNYRFPINPFINLETNHVPKNNCPFDCQYFHFDSL